MGFLVTLFWVITSWAASPELRIGWTDMRPGGSRSLSVNLGQAEWKLDVQDSELAPALKGVGSFNLKTAKPTLKARILQLEEKLKKRAQLLAGLPPKKEHVLYGRLNEHVVELDGKFGEELRELVHELLTLKWKPVDAHTVNRGKISAWTQGQVAPAVLPAQTLECRWDNTAWLCDYPEGLLQFSKVAQ
jgi:hypothetical protein